MLVELVAFPDVQMLDISGPMQVFASANELLADSGVAPPYEVRVVAFSSGPIRTSSGLTLIADNLPEPHAACDTLIVPGGKGVHVAFQQKRLVEWIREHSLVARRTVSICSGAFLLGYAGLLDNRRVTTHWADGDRLSKDFPAAVVDTDSIYINDGPIWTSAGVTAGIDLCLALVQADLGHDLALAVARDLVVYLKRPGGQSQYSALLSLQRSSRFLELHDWIRQNLSGNLTVAQLAKKCGMSERSFSRCYLAETGVTPALSVNRVRVETARALLLETRLPIKRIARHCGFGSEETFRRSFTRQFSVSPEAFRQMWT